jgi:hypothetical protein
VVVFCIKSPDQHARGKRGLYREQHNWPCMRHSLFFFFVLQMHTWQIVESANKILIVLARSAISG